jgi:hypothetical protein
MVAGALVAVGGIGYAALHQGGSRVKAAPSTSPSPAAPKAFGVKPGGTHYGSLGLQLLPMPTGYIPGQDISTYGNDTVLDAQRTLALIEGSVGDLSADQRAHLDASIGSLGITGMGLRTYAETTGRLVVQMEMIQMRNKEAPSFGSGYFDGLTSNLSGARKGPEIQGHPRAVCVVAPEDSDGDLEVMMCEAVEGDLVVSMYAGGPAPLDQQAAADLLRQQLDRIQDPGEAA